MEPKETIITTSAGSDTAGVGELRNVVPVARPSSSDDGQRVVYVAGTAPDTATVTAFPEEESTVINVTQCSMTEQSVPKMVESIDRPRQGSSDTLIMTPTPEKTMEIPSSEAPVSWVNIVEEEEKILTENPKPPIETKMEVEDASTRTAIKRKKERNFESDSLDESASDTTKGPRLRARPLRKRTPISAPDNAATMSKDCEVLTGSNPDSVPSGTDKEDGRGKVGRPRRKANAVDPIIAELDILKKTGIAPEHIKEELLRAMTAAEVCAQALEYISNIELIRTKCGRIQGGLSGELHKRTQGLGELVRELQYKAEAAGDPSSLKAKIEELLEVAKKSKKDRDKEDERRKRERSEFQEIIADLKKENQEIRKENREMKAELQKEMQVIRASIDRDNRQNVIPEKKEVKERKRVSFKKEKSGSPETSRSQRKSTVKGATQASSKEDSPTESTLAFQRLEEDLQNAYRMTGGDDWPKFGESWSSPSPPMSKKGKLNEGADWSINPSTQSRLTCTSDRENIPPVNTAFRYTPSIRHPLEGVPSTSRGIPTMVFTGTGNAATTAGLRPEIRLKENVQLVPPRDAHAEQRTSYASILKKDNSQDYRLIAQLPQDQVQERREWFTVGRGSKPIRQKDPKMSKRQSFKNMIKREKKRLPSTATISIRGSSAEFSYADALKQARENISLKDLDIQNPKIRKGLSGSTIIEISGPENIKKADLLAAEMNKLFKRVAKVSRPNIKGEIKLVGLDESISTDDVREAIALEGSCKPTEITVGQIGRNRSGDGIVWVKCPKTAALTLVEKKKIQIGWSRVSIELLPNRPIQCNKCWSLGHVQSKCKSNKDYTGRCFRCGEPGHTTKACKNKVKCIICAERRLPDNHRMGSDICRAAKILQSPHTSSETNVDSSPPKDTSSSPPTDAAQLCSSPSVTPSPENSNKAKNDTETPSVKAQRSSERRTDEQMEVAEPE